MTYLLRTGCVLGGSNHADRRISAVTWMGVRCRVLAHNYRVGDWCLCRFPGLKLGAGVGHDVADRVPDQEAEFGAGDVIERVPGHEQPPEHRAQ